MLVDRLTQLGLSLISRGHNDVMFCGTRWEGHRHLDHGAHEQSSGNAVGLSVDLAPCLAAYFSVGRASAFNPTERKDDNRYTLHE